MADLSFETRETVRALVEQYATLQVQDQDAEPHHIDQGKQAQILLQWGASTSVGEDEWIQVCDLLSVGAEIGTKVQGPRLVTLSIRCESYLVDHRAEWYLDSLRSAMKSPSFRGALYQLGFAIVRFESTVKLPVVVDNRRRSFAVMDLRLSYVSSVDDIARSTYIERVSATVNATE